MSEIKKHQPILDYIYKCMDALDKTGKNTEYYKSVFEPMSEDEFKKAMKEYLSDPDDQLYLEMDAFDQNVTIEELKNAAEVGSKLPKGFKGAIPILHEDYLVVPSVSENKDDPYVTNNKIMIGYLNQRRVQQVLPVKNHLSTGLDKRNPKTGQVIDEDKNARISDMELYQLTFQQAGEALAEFFGPRSDDLEAKNEMLYQIQRKGSVSLDELPNKASDKTALNYMNFLMLAAGYETDLISGDGLLPIVMERGGKLYKDE